MRLGSKKQRTHIRRAITYVPVKGRYEPSPGSKEYYSVLDLTDEMRKIFKEFGLKRSDLGKINLDPDGKGGNTIFDRYGSVNLNRYFTDKPKSHIDMPDDLVAIMPNCIRKLGQAKQMESTARMVDFENKVAALENRINEYLLQRPLYDQWLRAYVSKLKTADMKRLFEYLPAVTYREDTWCFWKCYSALTPEAQIIVRQALSECTDTSVECISHLLGLYTLRRQKDIQLQIHIQNTCRIYKKKPSRLRERLFKHMVAYLNGYDKHLVLRHIADMFQWQITFDRKDWSVLFTYEYLCKPEKEAEQRQVEDLILDMLLDPKYLVTNCTPKIAQIFRTAFLEERERLKDEWEFFNEE